MKHSYGWVIVGVGALMTCVAIGAMFSLAVYLQPMSVDTGWSRAGISSAMTLDFLAMGVAGFGWGAVSDRYGTRLVVLIGSAARPRPRAGQPCNFASGVSADLRHPHRRCGRRILCADDRGGDALV
jgi:MFS family permease